PLAPPDPLELPVPEFDDPASPPVLQPVIDTRAIIRIKTSPVPIGPDSTGPRLDLYDISSLLAIVSTTMSKLASLLTDPRLISDQSGVQSSSFSLLFCGETSHSDSSRWPRPVQMKPGSSGRWPVESGQLPVVSGQWPVVSGRW